MLGALRHLGTLVAVGLALGCAGSPPSPAAPAATGGASAPSGAIPGAASSAAGHQPAGGPDASSSGVTHPYLALPGERPTAVKVGLCAISGANVHLYTAQEGNLFQKYGLQVEPVRFPGGMAAVAALSANEVQLVTCGAENTLGGLATGLEAKLVAAPLVGVPYLLIARPDVPTVADLRGKLVGTPRVGSSPDAMTRLVLERHGLVPGQDVDVRAIPGATGQSDMYNALRGNAIQATVISPPFDAQARKDGLNVIYDIADLGVPAIASAVHANGVLLQSNPLAVQRFVAALAEAMHLAETRPEVTHQALAKALGVDDPAVLESASRAFAHRLANRRLRVPLDSLNASLDDLRAAGTPVSVRGAEDIVSNVFVDDLEHTGVLGALWGNDIPAR